MPNPCFERTSQQASGSGNPGNVARGNPVYQTAMLAPQQTRSIEEARHSLPRRRSAQEVCFPRFVAGTNKAQ